MTISCSFTLDFALDSSVTEVRRSDHIMQVAYQSVLGC